MLNCVCPCPFQMNLCLNELVSECMVTQYILSETADQVSLSVSSCSELQKESLKNISKVLNLPEEL